jgi:hypothetical protein
MGTSHSYICKHCDTFETASLEETVGMNTKVLAVKCIDCNAVGDSVIETGLEYDDIKKVKPICSKCESANVIKWNRKCSKCGNDMVDDGIFMCWD